MRISLILIIICLWINSLHAQPCPKYDKLMEEGKAFLNKNDLDKALLKFQAAQIAARECGKETDEPAKEIETVFRGLKEQRDDAIKAKKEADEQRKITETEKENTKKALMEADSARIEADTARAIAERERIKTKAALDQAEKLINAFYFYDGELALASKLDTDGSIKFGFINQKAEVIIDYKYDKAEQFDFSTGFAKVSRVTQVNTRDSSYLIDSNYFVDTKGYEYKVAYNLNDLNKGGVTVLDLRITNLTQLPMVIGKYNTLQFLFLSNNKLTQVPIEISRLNSLQSVDLSRNKLTNLPAEIGQLNSLQSLNLNYNRINSLPPEIGQLNSLQSLDLSYNQLESLPNEISQLNSLERLDLSHNNLDSLTTEIGKMNSLRYLDLSHNKLTQLPSEIWQLHSLKVIFLEGNNFSESEIENIINRTEYTEEDLK